MATATDERYLASAQPFGRWLLAQVAREDAIGDLARSAKADSRFPRDGDFEAISRRLNELQAESEMHLALEDAEGAWLSS
ncbi:MAG: YozE family protein [Sphingomonas sp.]|jgi:uncharacterized protein YozE (UPF0346 family)|uniref:YozE family protein n=1 Tax=Sphingomonas sp. TaxID=28214 RepID=UPI003562B256